MSDDVFGRRGPAAGRMVGRATGGAMGGRSMGGRSMGGRSMGGRSMAGPMGRPPGPPRRPPPPWAGGSMDSGAGGDAGWSGGGETGWDQGGGEAPLDFEAIGAQVAGELVGPVDEASYGGLWDAPEWRAPVRPASAPRAPAPRYGELPAQAPSRVTVCACSSGPWRDERPPEPSPFLDAMKIGAGATIGFAGVMLVLRALRA